MEPRVRIERTIYRIQADRIASNAYRANVGANAGNRNQVCRLPNDCSATELHRLGRRKNLWSGVRESDPAVQFGRLMPKALGQPRSSVKLFNYQRTKEKGRNLSIPALENLRR